MTKDIKYPIPNPTYLLSSTNFYLHNFLHYILQPIVFIIDDYPKPKTRK